MSKQDQSRLVTGSSSDSLNVIGLGSASGSDNLQASQETMNLAASTTSKRENQLFKNAMGSLLDQTGESGAPV